MRTTTLVAVVFVALVLVLDLAHQASPAESAFSGYNGRIVFSAGLPGEGHQLYTIRPDGSGIRELTPPPGHDFSPGVSADGGKVAFGRNTGQQVDLFVMNIDGSGLTQLPPCECGQASWSPDGQRLAVSVFDGTDNEIGVMNSDGSGLTVLTNNADQDSSPAWSPDGDRIAFVSFGNQEEIYVVNPDGSQLTNLTDTPSSHEPEFDWSPNGDQLVFTSDQQQSFIFRTYSVNEDGSNVSLLPGVPGHSPVWSPDGSAILSRVTGPSPGPALWITELATQEATAVENSEGASGFDWVSSPEPLDTAVGGIVEIPGSSNAGGRDSAPAALFVVAAFVGTLGVAFASRRGG